MSATNSAPIERNRKRQILEAEKAVAAEVEQFRSELEARQRG